MKIEVESAYIRTYIDDVLVDTYLDWSENLRPGLVGLRIDTRSEQCDDAYIDNVKVTEYDAQGNGTVTLFDSFEPNCPAWFPDAIIEEVDGNHIMHIYGDNVLYKWMQVESPIKNLLDEVSGEGQSAPAEFYNIQGMPVAAPSQGIYIVRRGNSVSKVVVR